MQPGITTPTHKKQSGNFISSVGSSPTGGSRFGSCLLSFFFFWYDRECVPLCACIKRSPLSFVNRNLRRHTRLNIDHPQPLSFPFRDGCTQEMNECSCCCYALGLHCRHRTSDVRSSIYHQMKSEREPKQSHLSAVNAAAVIKKVDQSLIKCWAGRKCTRRRSRRVCPAAELTKLWRRMGKFFSFSFSSAFILSFSILEDNSQCWRVCPISTRGRRKTSV